MNHVMLSTIKLSLSLSESLLGNLSDKISSLARDSLSEEWALEKWDTNPHYNK